MVQTWEDRIAYPGGPVTHLHIKLLALRVLQEEPEGLLPHWAVGAVDSLEVCRTRSRVHGPVPVLFLQKTLALMGSLKGTLHPKNSPASSCPHTQCSHSGILVLALTLLSWVTSWIDSCTMGLGSLFPFFSYGWENSEVTILVVFVFQ